MSYKQLICYRYIECTIYITCMLTEFTDISSSIRCDLDINYVNESFVCVCGYVNNQ